MDHVSRLRLRSVRCHAHGEHARLRRHRELHVADFEARYRIARGRAAVQHHRNEDVRHGSVGDRDGQSLAIGRQHPHGAADQLAALHGDERRRAGERRRHEDLRGVTDRVLLLVRDELDRVVIRHLPAREAVARDPQVGRRASDTALRIGDLGDDPERPGLRGTHGHAGAPLPIGRRAERRDKRVPRLTLILATAARDLDLRRHPLPVVDEHPDGLTGDDRAVRIDAHEVDGRRAARARHVLRRMHPDIERRWMDRDRRARGDALTVLIGHRR